MDFALNIGRPLLDIWLAILALILMTTSFLSFLAVHLVAVSTILIFAAWLTGDRIVHYLRLPAPDGTAEERLTKVLGPNPRSVKASSDVVKIAHRGAGLDAPENSLFAVQRASADGGATCIEFDVSFTKDGVPVIFHDDNIDRMTEDTGPIAELTYEQVGKLNLASKPLESWTGRKFTESVPKFVKIPTLDEMVDICLSLHLSMIIDLKTWNDVSLTVQTITSLFDRKPQLYDSAVVSSFFPHLIYAIRRQRACILTSVAFRPKFFSQKGYVPGDPSGAIARFPDNRLVQFLAESVGDRLHRFITIDRPLLSSFIGLSAILVQFDTASDSELVRQLDEDFKLRLVAWTVNDVMQMQYCQRYINIAFMSDTMFLGKE